MAGIGLPNLPKLGCPVPLRVKAAPSCTQRSTLVGVHFERALRAHKVGAAFELPTTMTATAARMLRIKDVFTHVTRARLARKVGGL